MAEFPALPLWTDAYLADCSHLSDAEHGVYLQVLMTMWRSPECRIPNDSSWLARRFRRDVHDVEKTIRPILAEFCKTDGNWVWQPRLQKEWEYCRKKSEKNSETAKLRWQKGKGSCERNAPTPTPTPTKIIGAAAPRTTKTFLPDDWSLPSEWLEAAKKARADAGLPALDWQAEAARFKAHWLNPDSKNRMKANWLRTWVKWCLSPYAKPAEQSKGRIINPADRPIYTPPPPNAEDNTWRFRLGSFAKDGFWITGWGPKPGERGCEAPAKILAEFPTLRGAA